MNHKYTMLYEKVDHPANKKLY